MGHYRTAVLVIRFFGLAILLYSVVAALDWAMYLIAELVSPTGTGFSNIGARQITSWIFMRLPSLLIALFLLTRAGMLARWLCRGVFPSGCCQRCGYNLAGAGLSRCPECGHAESVETPGRG